MRSQSRLCRITGKEFQISPIELELCEKLSIPLPTISRPERMRKLTAFNNYLNLHKGVCAATGESILQAFRPGVPFPVYGMEHWWSDSWSASSFGRSYDFSQSFFGQLRQLRDVVPQPALSTNFRTLENCDYVNGCSFSKNCYLLFCGVECQDCYFCFNVRRSQDCIDCTSVYDCELCYDSIFCFNCYELRHSLNCRNCSTSAFLKDCIGCSDCYGCIGLSHAQFRYFNQQLSPEEYRAKMAGIEWDSFADISGRQIEFETFVKQFPGEEIRGISNVDSTGDFIDHCKNAKECFHSAKLEDCANCLLVDGARDTVDMYTWGGNAELIYCTSRTGTNAYNVRFSFVVYNGASEIEYSMNCIGCKSCFGCIGLRQKEYCILNQQYRPEEYAELRRRIITQMSSDETSPDERYGEFLPPALSFFPYNDSDAMFFFPLEENEAVSRGFRWDDAASSNVSGATIEWSVVSKRTRDLSVDLTAGIVACERTNRPFRITRQELEAYQRRGLPIPRYNWMTRLRDRQARMERL